MIIINLRILLGNPLTKDNESSLSENKMILMKNQDINVEKQ